MARLEIAFRLPSEDAARARFVSDYGLCGAQVLMEDAVVLDVPSREALQAGAWARLPGGGQLMEVRASHPTDVHVLIDGIEAAREDAMSRPATTSAWVHAWLALAGSLFGFIAAGLYVLRSQASGDLWAMKMAWHMAGWHLLLTATLFPASVWGQRLGIRIVQVTSLVFCFIHLGIALSNAAEGRTLEQGLWIAVFNAASAAAFLAAAAWGFRAYADMNPNDFHQAATAAKPAIG